MRDKYFKFKKFNDSHRSIFDLGIPLPRFFTTRSMSDKHFINKVLALHPDRFLPLYDYHLHYFFERNDSKNEEQFLKKVISVCQDELEDFKYRAKIKSFIWDNKKKYEGFIETVESFINKLKARDKWGIILSENEQIEKLKKEIINLKQQVEDFLVLPNYKIKVTCKDKKHFFNLFEAILSIPDLTNESSEITTMFSEKPNKTWAKIVSNHFKVNNEDIPLQTALNYFDKTTDIKEKDRIFEIKINKRIKQNN